MKVLLYTEGLKTIGKSGLGKAIKHQMKALDSQNIKYTLDVNDDYDILHINTYFLKSYFFERVLSSAGSEHLPYKQRVGGSNPSTPTDYRATATD